MDDSAELFAEIAFRKFMAIVLRCHDFAIGSGRSDSNEIAAVCSVEVYGLAKYIGTLAYGTHHVVGHLGLVG